MHFFENIIYCVGRILFMNVKLGGTYSNHYVKKGLSEQS
jgi:hypothetical protein